MQDFNIKERWQELKEALRPMPWNKKLEHLWEYYKWVLVLLTVVGFIITIVCIGYSNARVEGLLYGEIVNLSFDTQGLNYLSEDFLEHLGGVKGDQKVSVMMTNLVVGQDSTYNNYYAPLMRTSSEISNHKLDFVLVDSPALATYFDNEFMLDLRQLFTDEELAQMGDRVVYVLYEETGEEIPMAINITDSAFVQDRMNHNMAAYLGFIGNTDRKETCRILYDYIMAYQPE